MVGVSSLRVGIQRRWKGEGKVKAQRCLGDGMARVAFRVQYEKYSCFHFAPMRFIKGACIVYMGLIATITPGWGCWVYRPQCASPCRT